MNPFHPFSPKGTNNARLAGMLRNLSSYFYKDPIMLYLVKVSQGLVHMGKGLMTLSPYHTERQLLSGRRGHGEVILRYIMHAPAHALSCMHNMHMHMLSHACTCL